MNKTETVAFKMEKEKKSELDNFCECRGLKIGKFLEKAVEHEIENRLIKESTLVYQNYGERKKTAIDYKKVSKQLGLE